MLFFGLSKETIRYIIVRVYGQMNADHISNILERASYTLTAVTSFIVYLQLFFVTESSVDQYLKSILSLERNVCMLIILMLSIFLIARIKATERFVANKKTQFDIFIQTFNITHKHFILNNFLLTLKMFYYYWHVYFAKRNYGIFFSFEAIRSQENDVKNIRKYIYTLIIL